MQPSVAADCRRYGVLRSCSGDYQSPCSLSVAADCRRYGALRSCSGDYQSPCSLLWRQIAAATARIFRCRCGVYAAMTDHLRVAFIQQNAGAASNDTSLSFQAAPGLRLQSLYCWQSAEPPSPSAPPNPSGFGGGGRIGSIKTREPKDAAQAFGWALTHTSAFASAKSYR